MSIKGQETVCPKAVLVPKGWKDSVVGKERVMGV